MNERDGRLITSRTFDPGVLQIAIGRLLTIPAGDVTLHTPNTAR